MKLIKLTTLALLTIVFSVVVLGCIKKPFSNVIPVETGIQNGQDVNTATTTAEIDTSDWKTYRNEEYGFEFKYPDDWLLETGTATFYVYSSMYREGLPEGGGGLAIDISDETLSEFIARYNETDPPFSKIVSSKNYSFNNIDATKLTGTTAIGIDRNFLLMNSRDRSYVISFHDFDIYHLWIVASFRLIE